MRRGLVVGLWLILVTGVWLYLRLNQLSAGDTLARLLATISSSPWGGLLLLLVFLLRPLLLLPITILNIFAGFLFGPVWGFGYALLATLASSSLAYLAGRFLSPARLGARHDFGDAKGLLANLQTRSFETVLLSRLMFVPGDLVNYAAGFLRISFPAFLAATALGGAAGLLMTVLAGAAIEGEFSLEAVSLNYRYLVVSALLLLCSLGVSVWLRRVNRLRA